MESKQKLPISDRYTTGQMALLKRAVLERTGDVLMHIEFSDTADAAENAPEAVEGWLKAHNLEDLIDPNRKKYICPAGRPPRKGKQQDPEQEEPHQHDPAQEQEAEENPEPEQEAPEEMETPHTRPLIPTFYAAQRPNIRIYTDAELEQEENSAARYYNPSEIENLKRELSDAGRDPAILEPARDTGGYYDKYNVDVIILEDEQDRRDHEPQEPAPAPEPDTTVETEPEPLLIVDGDTVTDGSTGEIITGDKAEAARMELDTRAEALRMREKNKPVIPPYIRTAPTRDFKSQYIVIDGHQRPNPTYISPNPEEPRYILNTLNHTDMALRCAAELRGEVINNAQPDVIGTKEPAPYWMVWHGTAYKHDRELVKTAVDYVIDTLYTEASCLSDAAADPKAVGALLKFANTSKNNKNKAGILSELRDLPGITVDLNKAGSQELICLKNIIFNAATGEIIKATDTARINEVKHLLPYHYIDRAYTPITEPTEYLKMVYDFFYDNTTPGLSDEERDQRAKDGAAWYIRYRGYVLYSGNPEGVNLFLIGAAHNGKTTLARASGGPLNEEYGELTTISELYAGKKDTLEFYSKLAPKRECLIDEGSGGEAKDQQLSGNFFKATTTAREITARGIYQHGAGIPHNLKRTFSMNEPPHFDSIDSGIYRRMVVPPCNHHYTEAEKITDYDKYLVEKEGDAILSLMIRECIHYINGNPNAPSGSPERKPGLLPVPKHWEEYKADILGGSVYTSFLSTRYEPITDPKERIEMYKVPRRDLYRGLIAYAQGHNCIDELGPLAYSNEVRKEGEHQIQERTLNKGAAKQLRIALIGLGFGDYINTKHDHGTAHIYAKMKFPTDRPTYTD